MKYIFIFAMIFLVLPPAGAQKLVTKTGHVKFYSHTPIEDIEANNRQAVSVLNTETGSMEFILLIRSFEFPKAMMQEHFNENYMESDTYPKSSFEGKITNLAEIDFDKPGTYVADVTGDLTIHGITKTISVKGKITVSGSKISSHATFMVKPADYGISIPDVTQSHIAEQLEVTVDANYTKM